MCDPRLDPGKGRGGAGGERDWRTLLGKSAVDSHTVLLSLQYILWKYLWLKGHNVCNLRSNSLHYTWLLRQTSLVLFLIECNLLRVSFLLLLCDALFASGWHLELFRDPGLSWLSGLTSSKWSGTHLCLLAWRKQNKTI